MTRWLLVAALPLLLGATGPCAKTDGTIDGEGVVRQGVGPECPQTWHVATEDGRMLWPLDDPAFQEDGLRVRFTARPRADAVSICMAGTMVEFISIRKL